MVGAHLRRLAFAIDGRDEMDNPYNLTREKLIELVQRSADGNWKEAVRQTYGARELDGTIPVISNNRHSWVHLLPVTPNATIVNIDTSLGAITEGLAHHYAQVVHLEPNWEGIKFSRTRLSQQGISNVQLLRASLPYLPFADSTLDIIVAVDGLERDHRAQKVALGQLYSKLRPGGVLLLGVGPTPGKGRSALIRGRANRILTRYQDLLAEAGFEELRLYVSHPSCQLPNLICPLDHRPALLALLRERSTARKALRNCVAMRAVRVGIYLGLRLGLRHFLLPYHFILARKGSPVTSGKLASSQGQEENKETHLALTEKVASLMLTRWTELCPELPKAQAVSFLLVSRFHGSKTVIKIQDQRTGQTLLVAKASNRETGALAIETEFTSLRTIYEKLSEERQLLRSIPRALDLVQIGAHPVLLQQPLDGMPFSALLSSESLSEKGMAPFYLKLAFQWMIAFHRALYRTWGPSFPQHGDYGASNLVILHRGGLGVQDWEDFGFHYPPLFDLFSLVIGFAYLARPVSRRERKLDQRLHNFKEVSFTANWLNEMARSLIREYCDTFGIPRETVEESFFAYIQVRYQKMLSLHGKRNVHTEFYSALLEMCAQSLPLYLEGIESS